jgi:ABC-type nitrate/sulfonate/bicarbonate transport system permease component
VASVAARAARAVRAPRLARGLAGAAACFVVAEAITRLELVDPRYLPRASTALVRMVGLLGRAEFLTAVAATLQAWAVGLAIAVAVAVPTGILLGSFRGAYQATRALVEFLRPIPSVALIPLAILIWGSGLESKVFLAAFASTWPLLMQTLYGVQDVDPVATDTARSFGFSRGERFLHVTLPSAGPYIATGIRISAAVSLILAVTAELVIGSPGLGAQINIARQSENVDVMYALIAVTGLLGWGVNVVFTQLEKRVLFWHPSQRTELVR